ncbi:MAG: NADP-dependent oxidoreductase [Actinomycetota bacterium]
MSEQGESSDGIGPTMRAIRLHAPGEADDLRLETVETPHVGAGEALVRVHAAAITRDELSWPLDRLPAIPSYELSGEVVDLPPGVDAVAVGDPVFALTAFDRDGAAAEYVAVPAALLAPRPRTLDHVSSAAIPLAGLSAWQGLFDHGHLEPGQRVLIHGAAGGVGHLATQLARWSGAHVIGTASAHSMEAARGFGAHEVIDGTDARLAGDLEPVDLVFDTVGGELLQRSPAVIRPGGRLVSVAEEPPETPAGIETSYFVVEPNRDELAELARLADEGELRPAIDAVFPLADAPAAFERSDARGKRGKVVLRVADEDPR